MALCSFCPHTHRMRCFSWKVHMLLIVVICLVFAAVLLWWYKELYPSDTAPTLTAARYLAVITSALIMLTALMMLISIFCLSPARLTHGKTPFLSMILMFLSTISSIVLFIAILLHYKAKNTKNTIPLYRVITAAILPLLFSFMFLDINTYYELSISDPDEVAHWK